MHKTTLEQWALLERVVEAGSFARAAEETHRSQSSVSYNLSLLQERLGVALLMTEGRRAVLTPAGELLLNQVSAAGCSLFCGSFSSGIRKRRCGSPRCWKTAARTRSMMKPT